MFNFGFGGFDDMSGAGRRAQKEKVDTTKLYSILAVPKDATQDQIKKAFRKQAMEHHPDKGGDSEKFKEIQKAYEILSDPEKRSVYDQYGEEAAASRGGSGSSSSAADIFSELFGGGGPRSARGPRRGEDTVFPLKVDLESLYKGDNKKLKLTKRVVCKACDGKGGKADAVQPCAGCKGRGIKVIIRQLGPGMIQQMQTACPDCKGEGQVMKEQDKCKVCKAEKTVPEEKILEVAIEKGMKHGDKVKFKGEGDQAPGMEPGDVICVLQQKEHAVFKRDGPHLYMQKHISLLEALTGFQFTVPHLDGRVLVVNSDKGVVYKPGDVKAVAGEGMPYHRKPFQRGLFLVELLIDFPASHSLGENERKTLAKILPPPSNPPMDTEMADAEMVTLMDVDLKAEQEKLRQQEEESSREAYSDDSEEHAHAGPQCRTQ